jgi:carboxyl-terminal processing protease
MTVNKWILVQMTIIIVLSFFLGYKTHQIETIGIEVLPDWLASSSIGEFAFSSTTDEGIITLKDLKEVQQAFEFMQRNYLQPGVTKKALIDGAITGGVQALGDQYSRYVPAVESTKVQEDIAGFYGGIGILVEAVRNGRGTMITSVFKSGPAYEVGIMAGDIIVKVEDTDTTEMFLYETVEKIKGPENTNVKITVYRMSIEDEVEFSVPRKKVKYPSVYESKILEGTDSMGYIQLIQFNNESAKDMKEAVTKLLGEGMKSLILDLRQNTGGAFAPSIDIADIFVDKGVMVYTVDRENKMTEYKGADNGEKVDIPLAVLVDGFSASASEILAGALKDYKAATIIGTKTFGKGVVQNVITLPQGGTLILTTSKYLTPGKHDINKSGIDPDIWAEIDFENSPDPFITQKYKEAEKLRVDLIAIRDELMKYLKEYDYQLEVAKKYMSTGELIQGAQTEEDHIKSEKEKAEKEKKVTETSK